MRASHDKKNHKGLQSQTITQTDPRLLLMQTNKTLGQSLVIVSWKVIAQDVVLVGRIYCSFMV